MNFLRRLMCHHTFVFKAILSYLPDKIVQCQCTLCGKEIFTKDLAKGK